MMPRGALLATAFALVADHVASQQDLAAVLQLFAADELPRTLSELGGGRRAEAHAALAAMGPRAHRYLLGHLRSRGLLADPHVSTAFGDFGPESTWAVPALLELTQGRTESPQPGALAAAFALLARVTPPGRDAPPLARALPALPLVDARWREPLLTVLADPMQQALWWQAAQAMIAIDDEAAAVAAAMLSTHLHSTDASLQKCAHQVLRTLEYHFAAFAVLDPTVAGVLPEPARLRELRRCVLANSEATFSSDRDPESVQRTLHELGGAPQAEVRRLAALWIALHAPTGVLALQQDASLLDRLAEDPDAATRELAQMVSRSADAAADERMHLPLVDERGTRGFDAIASLPSRHLARLPLATIREVLAACTDVDIAPTGPLGADLLRAAQRSRPATAKFHAHAALRAIAVACPASLQQFPDLTRSQRQIILQAFAATVPPPDLHGWLLDLVEPTPEGTIPNHQLSTAFAPTLLGRLRSGERPEQTLSLLIAQRNWADWAALLDKESATLVAAMPHVPAAHYEAFARFFTFGETGRRVLERLLLDATMPAAWRPALRKAFSQNLEAVPPDAAFVLACLDGSDEELRKTAIWAAGFVVDRKVEVARRLVAFLPAADERMDRALVLALGRLRDPAGLAVLRARMQQPFTESSLRAAVAVIEIDREDPDGFTFLRRALDADDPETRRLCWHFVSHSPDAAVLFLDEAVRVLGSSPDPMVHFRLLRLVSSAAKRRPDEARRVLRDLERHANAELANEANQHLRQLERDQESRLGR
jgi:hypothetical protein